ncbi:unnamed protein product [Rotaria sordida]|uniref:Uncharacterized protein n=1 Tax=Rotaria sordida TaxID=392033 RepID=A0A814C961_9BILA|nr:unnamed protein product [Rotaria sordida]
MCSIKIICSIVFFLLSLSNIYCDKDADINTLQQLISSLSRQDNSNWCCNTDPGVEATAKTRQTTYYVQRHARNKCGYSSCNLFGWGSCTRWCDTYWSEMQHGVETYIVYTPRLCPAGNLVCCAGYITVINHCFTYQEVMNNKDVLEILVSMGISINPTMG